VTKADYAKFEKRFAQFMVDAGITNLSGGRITCPECGTWLHSNGCCDEKCPQCGMSYDSMNEPSFSWQSCDCCNSSLGGDRHPASGYNPETKECMEFSICADCLYYATYGTMMDMEESAKQ